MTTELNWLSSWDTASFAEHLRMCVWDLTWFAETEGGGRYEISFGKRSADTRPWSLAHSEHDGSHRYDRDHLRCVGPEDAKAMRQELADELG